MSRFVSSHRAGSSDIRPDPCDENPFRNDWGLARPISFDFPERSMHEAQQCWDPPRVKSAQMSGVRALVWNHHLGLVCLRFVALGWCAHRHSGVPPSITCSRCVQGTTQRATARTDRGGGCDPGRKPRDRNTTPRASDSKEVARCVFLFGLRRCVVRIVEHRFVVSPRVGGEPIVPAVSCSMAPSSGPLVAFSSSAPPPAAHKCKHQRHRSSV